MNYIVICEHELTARVKSEVDQNFKAKKIGCSQTVYKIIGSTFYNFIVYDSASLRTELLKLQDSEGEPVDYIIPSRIDQSSEFHYLIKKEDITTLNVKESLESIRIGPGRIRIEYLKKYSETLKSYQKLPDVNIYCVLPFEQWFSDSLTGINPLTKAELINKLATENWTGA